MRPRPSRSRLDTALEILLALRMPLECLQEGDPAGDRSMPPGPVLAVEAVASSDGSQGVGEDANSDRAEARLPA